MSMVPEPNASNLSSDEDPTPNYSLRLNEWREYNLRNYYESLSTELSTYTPSNLGRRTSRLSTIYGTRYDCMNRGLHVGLLRNFQCPNVVISVVVVDTSSAIAERIHELLLHES